MKIISGKQILFFKNDTVLSFEAVSGQTLIHFVDGKSRAISEPIQSIEAQIGDSGFIRISRQHLVNVNCMVRITNGTDDFVELSNGEVLPINGKQKKIIVELISAQLKRSFEHKKP